MNINKILFDKYKREFFIKDITSIIKVVNDNYINEMSDELNEGSETTWVTYSYDFTTDTLNEKRINDFKSNKEILQDKLLHTKEMLAKTLLEEEYQLAAELKKLIDDIEDEIKKLN